MLRKLTEAECLAAVRDGDFDPALRSIAPATAIVLTQSWCPQWHMMRSWLGEESSDPEVAVLWVEYDLEPFMEPFMAFKEEVLGNRLIPYVRYHRGGILVKTSNYIDRKGFSSLLRG